MAYLGLLALVACTAVEAGETSPASIRLITTPADRPPPSPSSLDDEFDDGTVSAAWSALLHQGTVTVAADQGIGILQVDYASGGTADDNDVVGWTRAIPTPIPSQFTIVGKAALQAVVNATNARCGFGVVEDPSVPGSAQIILVSVLTRSGSVSKSSLNFEEFSAVDGGTLGVEANWNNWGYGGSREPPYTMGMIYFRLERDGGNYTAYYSADGYAWLSPGTITPSTAPVPHSIFFGTRHAPGSRASTCLYDFIRYKPCIDSKQLYDPTWNTCN